MSETLSPQEIAYYQELLDKKKEAKSGAEASWSSQHQLQAGSRDRDAQGRITEAHWEEIGKITDELIAAGILDGWGNLTEKALKLGLK